MAFNRIMYRCRNLEVTKTYLFLGMMNILIGLCVANIKDILKQKEDFKLAKMVMNNQTIEEAILEMSKMFKCCSLSDKIIQMASVLNGQNTKYKIYPTPSVMKLGPTILPLRFGNPSAIADMEVFQVQGDSTQELALKTYFVLPGNLHKPFVLWHQPLKIRT